jgi:type IV secretion system protein VirB5
MKTLQRLLFSTAMLLSSLLGAAHAQIPTTDIAGLIQSIRQVEALTEQLESMKNQLENQRQLYNSLNGSRGIGNLLNNPQLKDSLPPNWQKVYSSVMAGGYSGLTDPAKLIRDTNKIYECPKSLPEDQSKRCNREMNKTAQDKAFANDAYEASQRRLDNIQALMSQIDNASDQKTILDLQARIQTENAMIQNEQTKLQMFKMMSEAEDRLIAQQKHEQDLQDISVKRTTAKTWQPPKF